MPIGQGQLFHRHFSQRRLDLNIAQKQTVPGKNNGRVPRPGPEEFSAVFTDRQAMNENRLLPFGRRPVNAQTDILIMIGQAGPVKDEIGYFTVELPDRQSPPVKEPGGLQPQVSRHCRVTVENAESLQQVGDPLQVELGIDGIAAGKRTGPALQAPGGQGDFARPGRGRQLHVQR